MRPQGQLKSPLLEPMPHEGAPTGTLRCASRDCFVPFLIVVPDGLKITSSLRRSLDPERRQRRALVDPELAKPGELEKCEQQRSLRLCR